MDIKEIEAFVAIARQGGVTRAADHLHRSQPAISRRMRLLEDRLGAPLIERVRGRAMLTEAGEVFLPYAEAVLATIKDGADAVDALSDASHGSVMVALVGTLASTSIIGQLSDFRRAYPGVRVELCTARSAEVSDLVRRGEATFGLRYYIDTAPDLISEEVAAEAMWVVCSPDHPRAGKTLSDTTALSDDRWVGFPGDGGQSNKSHGNKGQGNKGQFDRQAALSRQLNAAGLGHAEIVVIDSLTAQKRLVEAGFGLALMPESAIQEELRLGTLAMIEVPDLRVSVPVAVVRRKGGYLGAASLALLEAIRTGGLRPVT
jgi:DNA-binding transcriptional LysR family regulator